MPYGQIYARIGPFPPPFGRSSSARCADIKHSGGTCGYMLPCPVHPLRWRAAERKDVRFLTRRSSSDGPTQHNVAQQRSPTSRSQRSTRSRKVGPGGGGGSQSSWRGWPSSPTRLALCKVSEGKWKMAACCLPGCGESGGSKIGSTSLSRRPYRLTMVRPNDPLRIYVEAAHTSMETGDQSTLSWNQFQSPMGPAWVQDWSDMPPNGKITQNQRKITCISAMYGMYLSLAYSSAWGCAGTTEVTKSGPGVHEIIVAGNFAATKNDAPPGTGHRQIDNGLEKLEKRYISTVLLKAGLRAHIPAVQANGVVIDPSTTGLRKCQVNHQRMLEQVEIAHIPGVQTNIFVHQYNPQENNVLVGRGWKTQWRRALVWINLKLRLKGAEGTGRDPRENLRWTKYRELDVAKKTCRHGHGWPEDLWGLVGTCGGLQ
ncbi:hypothetical protein B0H13DRAFT_1882003 [Mycena leptocephala]|nr:hypothetical protein B0H13DRAFT_1882003 [Mycena leptocephala]